MEAIYSYYYRNSFLKFDSWISLQRSTRLFQSLPKRDEGAGLNPASFICCEFCIRPAHQQNIKNRLHFADHRKPKSIDICSKAANANVSDLMDKLVIHKWSFIFKCLSHFEQRQQKLPGFVVATNESPSQSFFSLMIKFQHKNKQVRQINADYNEKSGSMCISMNLLLCHWRIRNKFITIKLEQKQQTREILVILLTCIATHSSSSSARIHMKLCAAL